jgi:hypothetical protein
MDKRTMHVKTMGWVVGLLCPLFGAGAALAEEGKEITGTDVVKQMAGKPECGDAGVTVALRRARSTAWPPG